MTTPIDTTRLVSLLEIVERKGRHLLATTARLFSRPIDAAWIDALEHDIALSERLDAFVARFGRMQDTLGYKLIPELRRQLLETRVPHWITSIAWKDWGCSPR